MMRGRWVLCKRKFGVGQRVYFDRPIHPDMDIRDMFSMETRKTIRYESLAGIVRGVGSCVNGSVVYPVAFPDQRLTLTIHEENLRPRDAT